MQNANTPPKIFASINQQSISPETSELIDYIFTGGNPARIAPTAYPESSQRLEESSQSRFRIFSCWLPCLRTRSVEENRDSEANLPNILDPSGSSKGPFGNQTNPLPRDPSVEVELLMQGGGSENGVRQPDRLVSLDVAPSVFDTDLKKGIEISSGPSMRTRRSINAPENNNNSLTLVNRGAGTENIGSLGVQRLVKSDPVIEV